MHPLSQYARTFARYLWREWIRPLALPVLLIASAKSAIADINYVPTGSMKPTILCGDVVFINKLAYDLRMPFTFARLARWSEPAQGDIVVCFAPDDGTRLVKRVIGRPGDTVELRNETLYLNGVAQTYLPLPEAVVRDLPAEERTAATFAREQLGAHPHAVMALPQVPARRNFGPIRVPTDHYFMLGDNRDNSKDSRFFGFVPRDEIIGEARGIFVSGDTDRWLRPRLSRFFSSLQ
jgi:signal peptidase I